jgi:hypothetical protein
MMATSSVFGRATAVLQDHANLRVTIGMLRALALAGNVAEPAPELAPGSLLDAFRAQLLAHFAIEESEGYFGTLGEERPSLRPGIARLRSEHEDMLRAVSRLLALSEDPSRYPELVEELKSFIDCFNAHESAENDLMQDFFSRDEGSGG